MNSKAIRNESSAPAALLAALNFAAHKHRQQRRKDSQATPYINHPIAVAEMLARVGGIDDRASLQAALLHDTLEDTQTTPEELEKEFGQAVRFLVEQLTDDKSRPREERKRLQIEHAPSLSPAAKQIKIADKICNLLDITATEPPEWNAHCKREYIDWAERVVSGCRGCNSQLEQHFDRTAQEKRQILSHARVAG